MWSLIGNNSGGIPSTSKQDLIKKFSLLICLSVERNVCWQLKTGGIGLTTNYTVQTFPCQPLNVLSVNLHYKSDIFMFIIEH